jgi:1,4-dihydroxy-2-naphthoyl-CoA hydrolase
MAIWTRPISVEELTRIHVDTAAAHIGLEFLEVGDDFIRGRVPVDTRTRQPHGILHGGVSVLLAETLGSTGAAHCTPPHHRVVGLEINANHIRAAREGWVTGLAKPVHIGRSTMVWGIELHDDAGKLTCASRLTLSVLAPR